MHASYEYDLSKQNLYSYNIHARTQFIYRWNFFLLVFCLFFITPKHFSKKKVIAGDFLHAMNYKEVF